MDRIKNIGEMPWKIRDWGTGGGEGGKREKITPQKITDVVKEAIKMVSVKQAL